MDISLDRQLKTCQKLLSSAQSEGLLATSKEVEEFLASTVLADIIERYNNTEHSSLGDITPNQAISDPKKQIYVMDLNMLKGEQNGFTTDLKPGDKVIVRNTTTVKKETESRWSDEVHVVQSASGKTVQLTVTD